MTMHCRPRHRPSKRDAVGTCVMDRADLPLDAANAEPAGNDDSVDAIEPPRRAFRRLAVVAGHPPDIDAGVVGEATRAKRLGDREIGVGQIDVLADQCDRDSARGPVHPAEQFVPVTPVHVPERKPQPADDVGVESLRVEHLGDVVDRYGVDRGDDRLLVDVAHQADLALELLRDRPVRPADDRVRLDTDAPQCRYRVLGRLGLELTGRPDVGQQRDMQEEAVVTADLVPDLADRLEERLRLDVADRAADLGDDDVDLVAPPSP